MSSLYYELQPYIPSGSTTEDPYPVLVINGHRILKKKRFKNKAQERAFDISLFLASKKPTYSTSRRMGDMMLKYTSPIILDTIEVIFIITHLPDLAIRLDPYAINPNKVAHDAMKFVPDYFLDGEVSLLRKKGKRKIWFLEIKPV